MVLALLGKSDFRRKLFESFKAKGYFFASVQHPSAIVSKGAFLLEGVQIMAGAILQIGCTVGDNSIINTKASVDHDTVIGSHVHIAPGVTLCGNVRIENCVHIGSGATIIQNIQICQDSTVGAGSLVIRNISANSLVFGVPAKEVDL